ncbi:hypothetical protein TNCV_2235011 [Trichonephila clavipes]|nr:hypothetical protein TNCV_2235011 [Trichonephila clavipes]
MIHGLRPYHRIIMCCIRLQALIHLNIILLRALICLLLIRLSQRINPVEISPPPPKTQKTDRKAGKLDRLL